MEYTVNGLKVFTRGNKNDKAIIFVHGFPYDHTMWDYQIDELKENYTIAIVTHSMQQAARVSQRTAYFHMGELIEVGATEQVFTNPRTKLTEDYITGRFG